MSNDQQTNATAAEQEEVWAGSAAKGTACAECRKQKVKCVRPLRNSSAPCRRCRRISINCINGSGTTNNPSSRWKDETSERLQKLESSISLLIAASQYSGSPPQAFVQQQQPIPPLSSGASSSPHGRWSSTSHTGARAPQRSWPNTPDNVVASHTTAAGWEDTALPAEPAQSLLQTTQTAERADSQQTFSEVDPISAGIVTIPQALQLFEQFHARMNQYLWGGVTLVHQTLQATRSSSSLLCTAIMTVASLQSRGLETQFDRCYRLFLEQASQAMFKPRVSCDDIRALLIGAFWLCDLSWRLSGLAIRMASELGLQRSVESIDSSSQHKVEDCRLWYLLYICDCHFSITYGRSPMMSHHIAVSSKWEIFLQSPYGILGDVRVVSQVALFRLLSEVYTTFGSDITVPISERDLDELKHFDVSLKHWHLTFKDRLAANPYIGEYPSRGLRWHYYFSSLQINSLALRGLTPTSPLSVERAEAADLAVLSAQSAISFFLQDDDLRAALAGMPLFKHTMLTFAALFLLKAVTAWHAVLTLNVDRVFGLLEALVALSASVPVGGRHLLASLSVGLGKKLQMARQRRTSMQQAALAPTDASLNVDVFSYMPTADEELLAAERDLLNGLILPQDWLDLPSMDMFTVGATTYLPRDST